MAKQYYLKYVKIKQSTVEQSIIKKQRKNIKKFIETKTKYNTLKPWNIERVSTRIQFHMH